MDQGWGGIPMIMSKLTINGVEREVFVIRNNHKPGIAYNVVAGTTLLGQIIKKSSTQWIAEQFGSMVFGTDIFIETKRRYMAVDHIIKMSGFK